MTTTGHRSRTSCTPPRPGGRPRIARFLLRSALLGAAVFAVAALTGALLSGTAPADLIADPTPDGTDAVGPFPVGGPEPSGNGGVDPTFAWSLVYSGTAALAVSVGGIMIVGRRRRQW